MTAAYPLQWPDGRPRSPRRERSRFKQHGFGQTRDALIAEVYRMDGAHLVLSTNIPLRLDGLPFARFIEPTDPGVAIYFTSGENQMAFSCDRWDCVQDNVHAIRLSIAAIRGIKRWGGGDMVRAAFTGFQALPPPDWRGDLGLDADATLADAERSFRKRAKSAHPDAGGTHENMARLNGAIESARKLLTP